MTALTQAIKDHEALKGQRGKIKDELHAVSVALAGMETKKAALTQALNLADRKVEAAEKARQLLDYHD
jgi:hypothetical protein